MVLNIGRAPLPLRRCWQPWRWTMRHAPNSTLQLWDWDPTACVMTSWMRCC